jgi:hypothetical protein
MRRTSKPQRQFAFQFFSATSRLAAHEFLTNEKIGLDSGKNLIAFVKQFPGSDLFRILHLSVFFF